MATSREEGSTWSMVPDANDATISGSSGTEPFRLMASVVGNKLLFLVDKAIHVALPKEVGTNYGLFPPPLPLSSQYNIVVNWYELTPEIQTHFTCAITEVYAPLRNRGGSHNGSPGSAIRRGYL